MAHYISYRAIERIRSRKEQQDSVLPYHRADKRSLQADAAHDPSFIRDSGRRVHGAKSDDGSSGDAKATLLVVDDDPDSRFLYSRNLEDHGYRVLSEPDAPSALAAIESSSDVQLVITDNRMPGMSGLELAGILRQAHPGVPVILLTACANIDNYLLSRDLGVFEFVDKSVSKGEFVRIVRAALAAHPAQ